MHFLIFLLLMVHHSLEIQLHDADEVERYISKLIAEFEVKPQDSKFSSVIPPPFPMGVSSKSEYFFPKVLIWSPQEHFGIQMKCPVHGKNLLPLRWTDTVSGKKDHDARLVYDIQCNVILVQRIYYCVRGRICHSLRSTSLDVLHSLPCSIQAYFPIELFQRSGCTKNLLQYIETQVLQGVNFLKISEGLASLNFQAFCLKRQIYLTAASENNLAAHDSSCSEFYSNPLFAFPSNDQAMNLFLNTYRKKKHLYEMDMKRVTATALSCDHTFKISRNIGLVREEDNKFITQFNQLFIALNENGEVLGWRLTKSTAFSEIQDLLIDIKKRLELVDSKLDVVCVDDCCRVRNKYNIIFPDVEVKLDLFHACQRVVRNVSPTNPLYRDILRNFSQIFREDDDQGEIRLKSTPKKDKIERNLNTFLERWTNVPSSPLTRAAMEEVENLRCHIAKGCLSDIPAGYGTEKNEQLHRLLNRSLISGATRISTELALALLTILLHYHTKKASSRYHSCNNRIKPIIPVDASNNNKESLTVWNSKNEAFIPTVQGKERNQPLDPSFTQDKVIVVMADNIDDVCNETIAEVIFKSAHNLKETIEYTAKQSCSRSFNALDMLNISKMSDVLCVEDNNYEQDPTINSHAMQLERQLAGFGLKIDPIQRDGDCAFRSVIREITKRVNDNTDIKKHLESLQLSTFDEDGATFALRQLFVKELTQENCSYRNFVTGSKEEIASKINEFQTRGVFDREFGDVVITACSNILRIPIMVITSSQSVPYVPFFPDDPLSNDPIYVAYHYYGAGHYDATSTVTTEVNLEEKQTGPVAEKQKHVCYCGRKAKSRSVHFCTTNEQNKSRCPCISNHKLCTPKCRCLNCMNRMGTNELKAGQRCRCGEFNRKKTDRSRTQSCTDIPGARRTKCPCFVNKQACTAKCSCPNCGNNYGKRASQTTVSAEKRRVKCTSSPSSVKRKRASEYHRKHGLDIKQGTWTLQETCILESVESFLLSTSIIPSVHNVTILYNYVVNSSLASSNNSSASHKTIEQVNGKLEYSQKRQEALKKLLYGIAMMGM